jgi:selenocysteine lyase/cysteine desulfurase
VTIDSADLARVRADIPVLSRCVFLNTGTLGPSPRPVTEAFVRAYTQWQDAGPGDPHHYQARRASSEGARADLAALLGVDPDEVALTANVTEALNIVFSGLPWQPGDEVVISDEEHPAVFVPALHLRRLGVRVRICPWERWAEGLPGFLGPRTRLLCASHVSSMTGRILPVAAALAAARSAGALLCLDGAQAVGQMALDVPSLGCDFYAFNAHKWLLAPVGSAGLVVRRRALDVLVPAWVGAGSGEADYAEDGALHLLPSARRFEFATRNWAVADGMRAAVAYARAIGLDRIAARQRTLSADLAARLAEVPGATVLGGGETGIVSVALAGRAGQEVQAALAAEGIVTRTVRERNAVRFSCAYFNTEAEMARAAAAVARLV